LILAVVAHSAAIRYNDGANGVLWAIWGRFSRLRLVRADRMYARPVDRVWRGRPARPIYFEVVKRVGPGFKMLQGRWHAERTFDRPGR